MHRELKMFLWVQSAKVSPLTRLGLFSLLQGSQGWKLPASQRGALKPCWHRRGGRSLQSCEVYGLKSGCQSAVIAQWEWAPPARAECQRAASHQQIIHSVFRTSQTRTKRGSSTWFPQTLSITSFISCFAFAEISWIFCHTSLVQTHQIIPCSLYTASAQPKTN